MKKNFKFIMLFYVVFALTMYVASLRMDQLESIEDIDNQNRSIVLKMK